MPEPSWRTVPESCMAGRLNRTRDDAPRMPAPTSLTAVAFVFLTMAIEMATTGSRRSAIRFGVHRGRRY